MPLSEDIEKKAKLTKSIIGAMEDIGVAKHEWLEKYGADSEPQVDLIIKEATDKAEEIVKMDEKDFVAYLTKKSFEMLAEIMARADDVTLVDEDEEKEFENERRENGNLKERIS